MWNGAKGRLVEGHADVDGQGHFVVKVKHESMRITLLLAVASVLDRGHVPTSGQPPRTQSAASRLPVTHPD